MGEALLSAEPRCLRVALEHEAVAVMHEPIEHGVGDGAIAEVGAPLTQRQLAGNEGRAPVVAVLEDLQRESRTVSSASGAMPNSSIAIKSALASWR